MKLFKHPCGSPVIADLYDELPAAERNGLIAEFYSRETALLGAKTSTATLKSLVEAWPSMDGTDRRSTMQRLILALQPIIEKGYVDPAPIHRFYSTLISIPDNHRPSLFNIWVQEGAQMHLVSHILHTHAVMTTSCVLYLF